MLGNFYNFEFTTVLLYITPIPPNSMLLRQLEYLLAVERFQSFTKAADFCCVTQPTLSQQIRTLESYLGIEVFDRSSLPIVATQKGNLILERAKDVVKQAAELEKFAKELTKSAENKELVF